MPLGKPNADGDFEAGRSRHYQGGHGDLGRQTLWKCPACLAENSGRTPEQGCVVCGAGDPRTSKAGGSVAEASRQVTRQAQSGGDGTAGAMADPRPRPGIPAVAPSQPIRVLRLIEYLITPGKDVDRTLRNSLVGTLRFDWGTLTGTIVDDSSARQEDLLGLARRQPGVWLANPDAMSDRGGRVRLPPGGRAPENPWGTGESGVAPRPDTMREVTMSNLTPPPLPDTGPAFSVMEATYAQVIVQACGLRIAYTLALALGAIAEELGANMEPEKFLSREECLSLANALMTLIPDGWNPEPEAPPPAPPPELL